MADFVLVSRRTLDERHHKIFQYHFLLGADWKLCCRRLGMSRGNFFHAVYRIEQRLGKAFYELEPYALYPPRDYFVLRLPGPIQACRSGARLSAAATRCGRSLARIPA